MIRIEQLLMLTDWFELPLIATFEHPVETKGWLPERLEQVFPAQGLRLVKRTFNCCEEISIRSALDQLSPKQIVLAGAETDVCILQSAMGLLKMGYEAFLLEDCVFTSEADPRPARDRMLQAGVIPCTYKMLYHELARSVDELAWPPIWQEKKAKFANRLVAPEDLPPWSPAT